MPTYFISLLNTDLNHRQVLISLKTEEDPLNLLHKLGGGVLSPHIIVDQDLGLILQAAHAGKMGEY